MAISGVTYGAQGSTAGQQQPVATSGSKSGSSSTSKGGTTTQTSNESSTQVSGFNKQNMTPESLAALEGLIAQLSGRMTRGAAEAALAAKGVKPPVNGALALSPGAGAQSLGPYYEAVRQAQVKYQQEMQIYEQQLQQEMAGDPSQAGTPETREQNAQREIEIGRNRTQQDAYSKEAAFTDATALTSRFTRQLMEQLMPAINTTVEASGTSGGAVSGLLMNDAAARTAESAAALGLETASAYGQISAGLSGVLEELTRVNPVVSNLLLEALGMAKGAVESGSQVQSSSGTKTTTTKASETASATTSDTFNQVQTLLKGALVSSSAAPASRTEGGYINAPSSVAAREAEANRPFAGYTDIR